MSVLWSILNKIEMTFCLFLVQVVKLKVLKQKKENAVIIGIGYRANAVALFILLLETVSDEISQSY